MKNRTRKIIFNPGAWFLLTVLLLLVGSPVLGCLRAMVDIMIGSPKYLVYGELHSFESHVFDAVEEKYGINIIRVDDDVIDLWAPMRMWDSYNWTIDQLYLKPDFHELLSKEIELLIERHKGNHRIDSTVKTSVESGS